MDDTWLRLAYQIEDTRGDVKILTNPGIDDAVENNKSRDIVIPSSSSLQEKVRRVRAVISGQPYLS